MNEIGLNIKTCDKFVALYIYVYFKALGIFNNDDGQETSNKKMENLLYRREMYNAKKKHKVTKLCKLKYYIKFWNCGVN